MNLLEKLERKWKTYETLHQLKDTLMRYGIDLCSKRSSQSQNKANYFRMEVLIFNP